MTLVITPPARSSAQEAAAIATASPQFTDVIEPVVNRRNAGAITTAAITAGDVVLYRFRVSRAITIATASVWIGGTAAGSIALGVYTYDGANFIKVVSTPSTLASGTNALQTIAFSSPATLALATGTDYWAAIGGDASTGTLTLLRATSTVGSAIGLLTQDAVRKASAYSSGLPTQITGIAGTSNLFWIAFTP